MRGLGARLDDRGEHVLLLLGVTLHGRDQVGDEVGAALVVVLHVGPFRLGLLLQGRNGVVAAGRDGEAEQDDGEGSAKARCKTGHDNSCSVLFRFLRGADS